MIACSPNAPSSAYPEYPNADTIKANRILEFTNSYLSTSSTTPTSLNDTIAIQNYGKEPTVYEAAFDSSRHILFIKKEEYLDTIKIIKFDFSNDSLILIDYQGTLMKKPNTHWYALYFIENDKVFLQVDAVVKNLRVEGEIADAYSKRNLFYDKLKKK
jgi:hypothetical protein